MNFMLVILHGLVTDEQLDAHISRMLEDQYDSPGKLGLVVMCKSISTRDLSFKAIFSAGKRMKKAKFRSHGKVAFVTKSAVSFGLARIYKSAAEVADLDEIRILRSDGLEKAIQWLGVEQYSDPIHHQITRYEQVAEYAVK
ncbi:hypothetical protein [Mariprofundus sp. EBB-1]|uniref:hypothetical protein n=1 Tax=Mariprofundus sp. EBB-1 TaxID=2650971 RepID=UPI0011C4718D|nr:hypothetical protein [Mariprofundus sp. EBB-1]